jgi:hypothetical protein
MPIHYAFARGPLRDKLLLKKDPRPEVSVDAAADSLPIPKCTSSTPAYPSPYDPHEAADERTRS